MFRAQGFGAIAGLKLSLFHVRTVFGVLLQRIDALVAPRRMAQASSWAFFFYMSIPRFGVKGAMLVARWGPWNPSWLLFGALGSKSGIVGPFDLQMVG